MNVIISFSISAKNRCLMEHKCMRSCYAQLNIYNFCFLFCVFCCVLLSNSYFNCIPLSQYDTCVNI